MENYVSREMRNYQILKVLEQSFAPGSHSRAPESIFDLHRKNILSYAAPWGLFTEKLEMSFDAGESRLQTYKSFFRKVIRKWENFEVKIFKVVFRRKFHQQLSNFGVKNNRIGETNDRLKKVLVPEVTPGLQSPFYIYMGKYLEFSSPQGGRGRKSEMAIRLSNYRSTNVQDRILINGLEVF